MRLPWQRKPQASVDPGGPHAFRPKSDGGSSALAPLGGSVGGQVADIGIASASTRAMGCAVPGCGKPSDALVHAPEE